jgi:hypothetical protein
MLQNIPTGKILEIVRQGPTFPAKIAKQLGGGGDTMLIGAILSTLISSGDIKVSTLKVGGTPVYYVPEQESKLEDFLNYLNEKDKKTFRLLKESKVLQDSSQDPLTRVSLRTIKDFAKPFEIDYKGQKVLFWRFYSLSKEDASSLAKKIVSDVNVVGDAKAVEVREQASEQKQEHQPSLILEPKPVAVEKPAVVQQVLEEHTPTPAASSEKIHEKHSKPAMVPKMPKTSKAPKPAKVPKVPKVPKAPKPSKVEYNFFELILNHVASKKLDVISKEKIKKTEYDLVLKNHETNEYIYCKAKDKSVISEADLAPALIFAQNKKMPCLFISTGELTKTASILITREFSGLKFERIVVSQ